MDQRVFEVFNQHCMEYGVSGNILEVGAMPDPMTLLNLPALAGRATSKLGLNMTVNDENVKALSGGLEFVEGNANDMSQFADDRFDAVLCNATLEHDRYFWKSIAEMRRVTKPGGILIIGTPGYHHGLGGKPLNEMTASREQGVGSLFLKLRRRIPALYALTTIYTAALTLRVHNYPGDYYRFSVQTYREVFFAGFDRVLVNAHFNPPVIIGCGVKPTPQ